MCYHQRVAERIQPSTAQNTSWLGRAGSQAGWLLGLLLAAAGGEVSRAEGSSASTGQPPNFVYTNVTDPKGPWSIHVVKVPRSNPQYEIQSRHAGAGALGLETLRDQIAAVDPRAGEPVAAINGGFYRRDTTYAGAARGLQIVGGTGEAISAPSGKAAFWIDLDGGIHLANVSSEFQVRWADGRVTPLGLNEARADNGVVLYTPAVGSSTHTAGGIELVLEREGRSPWLP